MSVNYKKNFKIVKLKLPAQNLSSSSLSLKAWNEHIWCVRYGAIKLLNFSTISILNRLKSCESEEKDDKKVRDRRK